MKQIIETIKRKWSEYLLEVIVIIVGIIGAFMVDSWHDNRQLIKIEKEKYSKMITDLAQDSTIIQRYLYEATDHQNLHYQIYHEIKGDSLKNEDLIYDYIIFEIIESSHFVDNHKGQLDEIRNTEVLNYTNSYLLAHDRMHEAIEGYNALLDEHLIPLLMHHGVYDMNNTFSQKGFYNYSAETQILDHERILQLKDLKSFQGLLAHLRMQTEYVKSRTSYQIKLNREFITFLEAKLLD